MKILICGLGSIGQRHLRNLREFKKENLEIAAYRSRNLEIIISEKLEAKFGQEQLKDSIANDEPLLDDNGDVVKVSYIEKYTARDIVRDEINEDWFFDKQRSVVDVRIIGIAPVVYAVNPETQEIVGLKKLFWLYFPECRYVFQNFFVYNPDNDAQRMSFYNTCPKT